MSSRRQISIPLGGRYIQVSLYCGTSEEIFFHPVTWACSSFLSIPRSVVYLWQYCGYRWYHQRNLLGGSRRFYFLRWKPGIQVCLYQKRPNIEVSIRCIVRVSKSALLCHDTARCVIDQKNRHTTPVPKTWMMLHGPWNNGTLDIL